MSHRFGTGPSLYLASTVFSAFMTWLPTHVEMGYMEGGGDGVEWGVQLECRHIGSVCPP